MKKFKIIVSIFFSVFFLLVNIGFSQSEYMINGTILGTNDQPISGAQVYLTEINGSYRKPIISHSTLSNGQFYFEATTKNPYRIWAMAPNYESINFVMEPSIPTKKTSNLFRLKLNPLPFNKNFEQVKIVGDWNNFDPAKAEPMKRLRDGTFSYERNGVERPVGYLLLNVVENRLVGGALGTENYRIEGENFIPIVKPVNSEIKIIFDPQKLPRADNSLLPSIKFDPSVIYLSEVFEMEMAYQRSKKEFDRKFWDYVKNPNQISEIEYRIPDLENLLWEKIQMGKSNFAKQYAATLLLKLGEIGIRLPEEKFVLIIGKIAANSTFWKFNPQLIGLMTYNYRAELMQGFLQNIFDKNPDRQIQAQALIGLSRLALLYGNLNEYQTNFQNLKTNYADLKEISLSTWILNPDNKISVGKNVPDFELKLIDSDQIVSNKSLLGKYYLIDFWATWCDPCKAEFPKLHQIYQKYKEKGLEILSVSIDESPDLVREYRTTQWKMPWLHSFAADGQEGLLAKKFGVDVIGLPRIVLVSTEGKILATQEQLRRDALDITLKRFLKDK